MTAWAASYDAGGVKALAPTAVAAFQQALAMTGTAYDAARLEVVRRRIAMVLQLPDADIPAVAAVPAEQVAALAQWPTSAAFDATDRALLGFAEQFVMDVSALAAADRAALTEVAGVDSFGFVQALYLLDHGARLAAVTRQLFGASPFDEPEPPSADGLWPALEAMMSAVMTIGGLDPLTAELVRLWGARAHACRLCQSRRRVAAVTAQPDLLEDAEPLSNPALTAPQRAALQLTDAILRQPGGLGAKVVADVHEHLSAAQGLEVALLVAHNAANKIAVAFGADAPVVSEGVEFYEVEPDGTYAYGLRSPYAS